MAVAGVEVWTFVVAAAVVVDGIFVVADAVVVEVQFIFEGSN